LITLDCDSVSATMIDDARIKLYLRLHDKGVFWMTVLVTVLIRKGKSDLSARSSTIEMRGEPSLRQLWKGI